jgi:hypothetical protein
MQLLLPCWFIIPLPAAETEPSNLTRYEVRLQKLFGSYPAVLSDRERFLISDTITATLDSALRLPGSFDYPFNLLRSLGKITSSDQKLRIYTWNFPASDGTNHYYGFVQYNTGHKGEIGIYRLNDNRLNIADPIHAALNPDNWYGCLYYQIIEKKISGIMCYTLLGFNPDNLFTHQKVIDILWFSEQDEPVFGKPVFHYQEQLQSRILFTYSAKAVMSLTWNSHLDMIAYDHLSPSQPSYTGNYLYYGPDFSYDGLRFDKGIWESVEDIDVRNRKE